MSTDAYSLLVSLYQTAREAVGVARRAGLPIQFIDAEGAAITVWSSIVSEARKRNMLASLQLRIGKPQSCSHGMNSSNRHAGCAIARCRCFAPYHLRVTLPVADKPAPGRLL